MSVPDASIDPRILESARAHFLKDGFEKTSLKAICDDAGITTGALYKRYAGKEALFTALVQPALDAIDKVVKERSSVPVSLMSDEQLKRAWQMDREDMHWWMDFLYEYRDGFSLLLRCSEGTAWSGFNRDFVGRMTELTWQYWEEALRRGLSRASIRKEEMHILLSAFWQTIYEPFIQNFELERIDEHCELICRLFNWCAVLGF